MGAIASVSYSYMPDGRIKCTFVCNKTGFEFAKFYKTKSAANAATTKFFKKVVIA